MFTLALGATSGVAEAVKCPAVVVGANNPAMDAFAVQQAVDQCANVRLQGTFDFTGRRAAPHRG